VNNGCPVGMLRNVQAKKLSRALQVFDNCKHHNKLTAGQWTGRQPPGSLEMQLQLLSHLHPP